METFTDDEAKHKMEKRGQVFFYIVLLTVLHVSLSVYRCNYIIGLWILKKSVLFLFFKEERKPRNGIYSNISHRLE